MKNNITPFQQIRSKPKQVPTLAKSMHVLMQALADDDLNYQQLAKIIKQYPGITARIIFLANSTWSAPIAPISSIELACSRLGITIVKSISLAISISSSFSTKNCPFFNTVHFWTTALLVSEGAGLLASKLPDQIANLEFEHTVQTAGILHSLGLLWLADNLPSETNNAFQLVIDKSSSHSVIESLRQCTGTDYSEVAGWLAQELKFPEVLITILEQQLNQDYQESSWEMALIIRSAAQMASALHKQSDKIPTISRLEILGLDSSTQNDVFQQLSNNFEKTCELANLLFEG